VSERVGIVDSSLADDGSIVTVSVLSVVIFVVFVPIMVITIVLLRNRCSTRKLKKELNHTRYIWWQIVGTEKGSEKAQVLFRVI
jgi:hypothetical protein